VASPARPLQGPVSSPGCDCPSRNGGRSRPEASLSPPPCTAERSSAAIECWHEVETMSRSATPPSSAVTVPALEARSATGWPASWTGIYEPGRYFELWVGPWRRSLGPAVTGSIVGALSWRAAIRAIGIGVLRYPGGSRYNRRGGSAIPCPASGRRRPPHLPKRPPGSTPHSCAG
jgi:hypothetical protein